MFDLSIILQQDSYKFSQWKQYPEGTEYVYSYVESRGGEFDETIMFGLQAFIDTTLIKPVTQYDVEEASRIAALHGVPFNREGWEYIVNVHGGKLPLLIKAVPEGTIVGTKNVLATVVNTDPKCFWLTSYVETTILRAIWYGTTVATNSYESKKIILQYLRETGDPSQIAFKLNDFGARGVSSLESSAIGGAAHLINFMGTDNIAGIMFAAKYYGADMCGFSIPAMEHSTVTSWGREHEVDSYRNMLKQYARPGSLLAVVSDSYDIYAACHMWGTKLKDDVINSGATVIIRPDSGEPSDVVVKCLRILDQHFGSVVNDKGYRVLNNVRVIQGDGIDHSSIRSILFCMDIAGYSADNVAFGQGGALLQLVNRDICRFAMKCSAIGIREMGELVWSTVTKDPITDPGKKSKGGMLKLVKADDGSFYTVSDTEPLDYVAAVDDMVIVYRNGEQFNKTTFEEIRARASK